MSHNPAGPRAVVVRATRVATAIADAAGWKLDILGIPVSPRFAHHLYVASADLVILPSPYSPSRSMTTMSRVLAEARCAGLIVSVTAERVELALAFRRSRAIRWFVPMALWLGDDGLWIVPDPYHALVRAECFPLAAGRLRPTAAPWTTKADEQAGRARAAGWIASIIA